jgi:hypothetical protein
MKYRYVNYNHIKQFIQEGDILLIRPKNIWGYFIAKAGYGLYSHTAMASWHNGTLECIEFKEFIGGRTISMDRAVSQYGDRIDFFRVLPQITELNFKYSNNILYEQKISKKLDAYKVTQYMRNLTGLPYGWLRVAIFLRRKVPFLRWLFSVSIDDKVSSQYYVYPVCSTAIALSYNKMYTDLVPFKSDFEVEPSDLSRSKMLYYMFTIKK